MASFELKEKESLIGRCNLKGAPRRVCMFFLHDTLHYPDFPFMLVLMSIILGPQ